MKIRKTHWKTAVMESFIKSPSRLANKKRYFHPVAATFL